MLNTATKSVKHTFLRLVSSGHQYKSWPRLPCSFSRNFSTHLPDRRVSSRAPPWCRSDGRSREPEIIFLISELWSLNFDLHYGPHCKVYWQGFLTGLNMITNKFAILYEIDDIGNQAYVCIILYPPFKIVRIKNNVTQKKKCILGSPWAWSTEHRGALRTCSGRCGPENVQFNVSIKKIILEKNKNTRRT